MCSRETSASWLIVMSNKIPAGEEGPSACQLVLASRRQTVMGLLNQSYYALKVFREPRHCAAAESDAQSLTRRGELGLGTKSSTLSHSWAKYSSCQHCSSLQLGRKSDQDFVVENKTRIFPLSQEKPKKLYQTPAENISKGALLRKLFACPSYYKGRYL